MEPVITKESIRQFESSIFSDCHSTRAKVGRSKFFQDIEKTPKEALHEIGKFFRENPFEKFQRSYTSGPLFDDLKLAYRLMLQWLAKAANITTVPLASAPIEAWFSWAETC